MCYKNLSIRQNVQSAIDRYTRLFEATGTSNNPVIIQEEKVQSQTEEVLAMVVTSLHHPAFSVDAQMELAKVRGRDCWDLLNLYLRSLSSSGRSIVVELEKK